VTPPGSGQNKPTPEGSHVSSILGRKAHNGTMKHFLSQGAQWHNKNIYSVRDKMYNKNIYHRKGQKAIDM
jgi:hypothetical protein